MIDDIDYHVLVDQVSAVLDQYGDDAVAPLIKALCKEIHDLKVVVGSLIEESVVRNRIAEAQVEAHSRIIKGCVGMELRISDLEEKREATVH